MIFQGKQSTARLDCLGREGAKCLSLLLPLGAGLNGRDCKVKRSQPACQSGFPFKSDGSGRTCAKSLLFSTSLARQVHDSITTGNNDPLGCIPRPALTPTIPSPWPIPRAGDTVAGFWSVGPKTASRPGHSADAPTGIFAFVRGFGRWDRSAQRARRQAARLPKRYNGGQSLLASWLRNER
jgi:hypothetical protein